MNEYTYKVPSCEEIISNFDNHCLHPYCTTCKFNNTKKPNVVYECAIRFTKAVLSGDMRLTDSFRTDEPKPEPKIPSWCKVGAWVLRRETAHMPEGLTKIRAIDGKKIYTDDMTHVPRLSVEIGDIKPVRFRKYTFEEARKMMGKEMEFTFPNTKYRCKIKIQAAGEAFGCVKINSYNFKAWQNWDATVDGVPIGVPEVDEEALKGGRQ